MNMNPEQKIKLTDKNLTGKNLFVIFFLYFMAAFMFAKLHSSMAIEHRPATLYKMFTYTAATPYQYRILVIWLIKLFLTITRYDDIIKTCFFLKTIFIFLSMVCMRKWFLLFVRPSVATIGPFLLGIIFPFSFLVKYTNDFAVIFFSTLLLYLLYKKNWGYYYLIFVLATFNKETSIIIVLIFLVTQYKQMTNRELFFQAAAQLIIWLEIKLFLFLLFSANAGEQWEFQLRQNLFHLALGRGPFMIIQILSAFGFFWLIAFYNFKQQPRFLRLSSLALIPYALIMLFVGMINETRIWYEFIPVILAMALINIEKIENDRLGYLENQQ